MFLNKKQVTLIEVVEYSVTAKIKRGVRQGCLLSRHLILFIYL